MDGFNGLYRLREINYGQTCDYIVKTNSTDIIKDIKDKENIKFVNTKRKFYQQF